MSVRGKALLIGGATASGKSALAVALARRLDGVVVNADSVQLYRDLPLLTARPDADELRMAPHRLYGFLPPDAPVSAAVWLDLVLPAMRAVWDEGRLPILTGGSGLYLHALLHGLAPVPPIPDNLRAAVRALPHGELLERLGAEDPRMAARLRPNDRQRLMRALEVVRATGRSLADWQDLPRHPPLPGLRAAGLVLLPDRALLRRRIQARMAGMVAAGAIGEVRDLRRRVGDPLGLPIAKVHGLPELLAVLDGRLDESSAIEAASLKVGQYAKRQSTWFRRQLPGLAVLQALGAAPEALAAGLGLARAL